MGRTICIIQSQLHSLSTWPQPLMWVWRTPCLQLLFLEQQFAHYAIDHCFISSWKVGKCGYSKSWNKLVIQPVAWAELETTLVACLWNLWWGSSGCWQYGKGNDRGHTKCRRGIIFDSITSCSMWETLGGVSWSMIEISYNHRSAHGIISSIAIQCHIMDMTEHQAGFQFDTCINILYFLGKWS